MTSESVTAQTATLIDDLYDRLWDAKPPQDTRRRQQASRTARLTAAERGWLPPLAWDDIDHDPDSGPRDAAHQSIADHHGSNLDEIAIERALNGNARVYLTHAEQVEVVSRMTGRGGSIRAIAELLSISTRTVSRYRRHLSSS